MTRLLAVAVSFALLDAVWAGDVKSVPEIKADVNPAKQTSTPLTAPVPADPKASVPDLGRIPLVVVPEAQVPAANAAPGALLQPVSQPKAEPQAGPPSVDNEVSAGRIQFDQAQTITATSPGLETGAGAATTIHVSGLTLGPRSSDGAPSARGPPGVGGDGATAEALFAQVLDRAVARGRLTPELRKELLDAAYRDPLTGLYNRLYLDAHVADLSRRYPSLATFKLDSLKEINDSYDHETGNKFMKAMAAVGERVVGPDGVVVRRSPTGFAVFLDAPIWDARLSAEALRLAVSRKIGDPSVILGHTVTASAPGGTISVGVAALESGAPAAQSYREAYAKAEGARQLAKEQGGGDRVAYDDDDSKLMDRRTLEEAVSTLKRRQKDAAARRLEDVDKEDLSTLMQEHDSTAPKPAQVAELLEKLKDPAVRHMAFSVVYRDRLSGLLNRRYLFDHIDALLNGYTSYMALDLDKFGDLNAAIGEDKADLVLAELGALLAEGARRQDALPLHLSGEEFVVLGGQRQLDPKALGEALRVKVRDELGRRVADKYGIVDPATSRPFEITVSIGVAPIKHEGGAADQKLALVNAMAESLLQRAKSNGRDRVEVGAEGLTALLSRVVRVDETVRGVVDGLMKPAARPAPGSAFLDNSFKTRGEVVRALKFNPASEPGTLLSDPNKGGSETLLVSPPGLEKRVVKISDQEVISNETLLRGIVESFEMFNSRLASPKSVAYKRFWPLKPVLVQEHYEGAHNGWMDITNLPLAQKVALWLLAGTFGVHGFNAGAFLDVNFSRSVIVDFEMSRGLFGLSQGPLPIGAGSFHPWVAENYLNEAQDYRLALKSWRETFAKPETKAELVRLMRRAAIPERRIAEDLKTFESNLSILDQSLERDIATGNRDFMDAAKRAGLDERQTTSLSFVNKAAHMSPQGGIFRDLVRLLNRRVSRGTLESKGFALKPEEWRQLLSSRPQGLTEADREAVLGWAEGGTLSPPRGGAAYTTAAARSALKHLGSLLKP